MNWCFLFVNDASCQRKFSDGMHFQDFYMAWKWGMFRFSINTSCELCRMQVFLAMYLESNCLFSSTATAHLHRFLKSTNSVSIWSWGRMECIEENGGTWTRKIWQYYFPVEHAAQVCFKCRGSQRHCSTILQYHRAHFMARQTLTNSYWTYNVASSNCKKTRYFNKFASTCKIQYICLLSL